MSNEDEKIIEIKSTEELGPELQEGSLVPEGIQESGIVIGESSEETQEAEDEDEDGAFYLGDHIEMNTGKYGLIKGQIYYYGDKLLSILPDGVSNRLIEITMEDNVPDPEVDIKPDSIKIIKGPRVGFVEFQGFHVDQVLQSFVENGDLGPLYTVTSIDTEDDRMTLQNTKDDTEPKLQLECNFEGIPSDLPFKILIIKSQEDEEIIPTEEEVKETELAIAKAQTPGAESAEILGEEIDDLIELDDLEAVVGTFYITKTIEMQELSLSERIYSELAQKSEFIIDLISMVESKRRKNPIIVKQIRAIAEIYSSLKNSIIKRSKDGRPVGEIKVSLNSFSDILDGTTNHIVRPVLETKRILVAEKIEQTDDYVNAESISDEFIIKKFKDLIDESTKYLERQADIPTIIGSSGVGIPRWYQAINQYFEQYPLGTAYGTLNTSSYKFESDSEYFCSNLPGAQDDSESSGLKGLKKITLDPIQNEQYSTDPLNFTGNIFMSLRRGHGPVLKLTNDSYEILSPADKAQIYGYVVFPYKYVASGAIGGIRTGNLWTDILRSNHAIATMQSLLTRLGGIKGDADAQHAFYLPLDDPTAIGISFSDFIEFVLKSIVIRGQGDIKTIQYDLGVLNYEINLEQQLVIEKRVKEVLAYLKTSINTMRQTPFPEVGSINPLFTSIDFSSYIETQVTTHPMLQLIVKNLEERTPGYKNVDIAIMGSLILYAKDYTFAVLGKNIRQIEKERISLKRYYLSKRLHERLEEYALKRSLGQPPQPNPCVHVKELEDIRRANVTDSTRMGSLARFVQKYKGEREENWINCNICKEHLLCHHEILQIQQFLHPQERDALQKHIILDYAGGLYGANYICRNCGLPIGALDFDKSIEYDDNGMPMMGRAEIVDADTEEIKDIMDMFFAEDEEAKVLQTFDTPQKKQLYDIAVTMANYLHVPIDTIGYKKIVDRTYSELLQQPTEVVYNMRKTADGKKSKTSYTEFIARIKILYMACFMLIEIQTHTPPYQIEYSIEGCEFGFEGYPLNPNIEASSTGVNYVACVIAQINDQIDPWIHGFQKVSTKENKRANSIGSLMKKYIETIVSKSTSIQTELEKRRSYSKKEEQTKTKQLQRLPANFLPRMDTAEEEAETSVKGASIPEGSSGAIGEILKSNTWIRSINALVRKNTDSIRAGPFSETSCCFSEITMPGKILRDASLPPMPTEDHLFQSFRRRSILYTPMIARSLQVFNATPALGQAYRVFLELCYTGPRVGLPHELGYDLQCDWCNIKVPTEYKYPDIDYQGKPKIDENALLTDFNNQGISITDQSFQALLDAAHTRTLFNQYRNPIPDTPEEIIGALKTVEEPPVTDWVGTLNNILENMSKLSNNPSDLEIIQAYAPLSEINDGIEQSIIQYAGPGYLKVLESIIDTPVYTAFEVLRSYFLVPAQRLLNNYDSKDTLTVQQYYKLASEHSKDLQKILQKHTDYTTELTLYPISDEEEGEEESPESRALEKARLKFQTFVDKLSELLKQSAELRVSRIRVDMKIPMLAYKTLLKEIVRTIVMGPISDLLNPNVLPSDESYEGIDTASSDSIVKEFIEGMITKYRNEYLSYNPAIVKQKLEDSKEKEKQRFIKDLDEKNLDEKRVELMKKRLGIGKWAIGGTKLVYAYDPEQWEKNRQELLTNYGEASGIESVKLVRLDDGMENGGDTGEGGYDTYDNHGDGDDE